MSSCSITTSFLRLFLFCCYSSTERSAQSVFRTPGQFIKGNARKAIKGSNQPQRQVCTLVFLSTLLARDVHCNPGLRQKSYYPCGLCDRDVQCTDCIAWDDCSIWYHRSCTELFTTDFEVLQRSSVQWMCPKCNSINCDTFPAEAFFLHLFYQEKRTCES